MDYSKRVYVCKILPLYLSNSAEQTFYYNKITERDVLWYNRYWKYCGTLMNNRLY